MQVEDKGADGSVSEGLAPDVVAAALLPTEGRTMVKYTTVNPVWEEDFWFRVSDLKRESAVRLTVMSTAALGDLPLGSAMLVVGGAIYDDAFGMEPPVDMTVTLPLQGKRRGRIVVTWSYEGDGDEDAVRGANILRAARISRLSPLATLPANVRRMLAQAQAAGLGGDVVRHLPVMEPVFRHIMERYVAAGRAAGAGTTEMGVVSEVRDGITEAEFVGLLSQVSEHLHVMPPTIA